MPRRFGTHLARRATSLSHRPPNPCPRLRGRRPHRLLAPAEGRLVPLPHAAAVPWTSCGQKTTATAAAGLCKGALPPPPSGSCGPLAQSVSQGCSAAAAAVVGRFTSLSCVFFLFFSFFGLPRGLVVPSLDKQNPHTLLWVGGAACCGGESQKKKKHSRSVRAGFPCDAERLSSAKRSSTSRGCYCFDRCCCGDSYPQFGFTAPQASRNFTGG